jgi:hypothetical protein
MHQPAHSAAAAVPVESHGLGIQSRGDFVPRCREFHSPVRGTAHPHKYRRAIRTPDRPPTTISRPAVYRLGAVLPITNVPTLWKGTFRRPTGVCTSTVPCAR